MSRKPYTAKTISGAQRRVRDLMRLNRETTALLDRYGNDRKLLAKLAADGPAFNNPLMVMEAKRIRDEILYYCGLKPDGSPL